MNTNDNAEQQTPPQPQFRTLAELAAIVGLEPQSLRLWVRSGDLPAWQPAGSTAPWLSAISDSDLLDLAARKAAKQGWTQVNERKRKTDAGPETGAAG